MKKFTKFDWWFIAIMGILMTAIIFLSKLIDWDYWIVLSYFIGSISMVIYSNERPNKPIDKR